MENNYICIHGHFYQPSRENPWLEKIELQDSAYPYHDWNVRIAAECYAPNTAARILSADSRIIDIVNTYSKISFDFGPTLLAWLKQHEASVYQAILDADKQSRDRFSGHGCVLAQPYNHMIMPLANSRDKQTQILWGIRDFEHRFKRQPEGMWLPETAVDFETLELLVRHGIKFTVLAPRQAGRVRKIGDNRWRSVGESRIDSKMPYKCAMPDGDSIAVFFYDGAVSQEVAFGGLLNNGRDFAERLNGLFDKDREGPQLVHIATDGETYGHHHAHGDMALAYCIYHLETNNLARFTVYGEYLEKFPPTHEVEIEEFSSWSCVHGVERWRNDCGCNTGKSQGWTQGWRAPLRGALDWLRDNVSRIYEKEASLLLKDPWQARDDYIRVVLDRTLENTEGFIRDCGIKEDFTAQEKTRLLQLLEMQRHAMLMYTSCGWFFDEIYGIETTQIIQYAARVIQLAEQVSGIMLEEIFKGLLERAPSNIAQFKHGAFIYETMVKPAVVDILRVGVHYGVTSLFKEYGEDSSVYSYSVKRLYYDKKAIGRRQLAVGAASIASKFTLEEKRVSIAVVHLGDHNIIGAAKGYEGQEEFQAMKDEIEAVFSKGEVPSLLGLFEKYFKDHRYTLSHLFRDEQREIIDKIFENTSVEIETIFRRLYEEKYHAAQAVASFNLPLPRYLSSVLEFILNTDLRRLLEKEEIDYPALQKAVEEIRRWGVPIDNAAVGLTVSQRLNQVMEKWSQGPQEEGIIRDALTLLQAFNNLRLNLDLWRAQNTYFYIGKKVLSDIQQRIDADDRGALALKDLIVSLGDLLRVKII